MGNRNDHGSGNGRRKRRETIRWKTERRRGIGGKIGETENTRKRASDRRRIESKKDQDPAQEGEKEDDQGRSAGNPRPVGVTRVGRLGTNTVPS